MIHVLHLACHFCQDEVPSASAGNDELTNRGSNRHSAPPSHSKPGASQSTSLHVVQLGLSSPGGVSTIPTKAEENKAATELRDLLEENPELLKELDSDLIRICEELEVI